eukprot:jgi/Mesvir1/20994/Mv08055-RA.1
MSFDPTEIVSAPSCSIYKLSRTIKALEQTAYNMLRSIYEDSSFVAEIHQLYPSLPLIANLRCGRWYAPSFTDYCYFKSTDGHTNNCSFSLTRTNMHLAERLAQSGGAVVVDSTRKGKRFPDSFSKTVPVWACVLNRAIHRTRMRMNQQGSPVHACVGQARGEQACGQGPGEGPALGPSDRQGVSHTQGQGQGLGGQVARSDSDAVPGSGESMDSDSLNTQEVPPAARLEGRHASRGPAGPATGHVAGGPAAHHNEANHEANHEVNYVVDCAVDRVVGLGINLEGLARDLKKPLRPLWVSQQTVIWINQMPSIERDWDFTPIILLSASLPVPAPVRRSGGVLGAATDGCGEECSWCYVPGAGDDEESWAMGLTPELFWKHRWVFLDAGPTGCPKAIARVLAEDKEERRKQARSGAPPPPHAVALQPASVHGMLGQSGANNGAATPMASSAPAMMEDAGDAVVMAARLGDTGMVLGNFAAGCPPGVWDLADAVINVGALQYRALEQTEGGPPALALPHFYLHLPVVDSKLERHSLCAQLPAGVAFISAHLAAGRRVLVHGQGEHGIGVSACFCLAVLASAAFQTGAYIK